METLEALRTLRSVGWGRYWGIRIGLVIYSKSLMIMN